LTRILADWRVRAGVLSCFIVAPFLKFVAANGYGLLHTEVAAAIALLLIPCLVLGWLARGIGFYCVAAACLVMAATFPLVHLIRPVVHTSLGFGAIILTICTAAMMAAMRERFFVVAAVFTWSGVGIAMVSNAHWDPRSLFHPIRNGQPDVLWLLLDEQIGPGGFPARPECDAARTRLTQTLAKYNFSLYPNTYSNYAGTIDSVPSILNGRLLQRPQELIERTGEGNLRQYQIRANSRFDHYAAQGYSIVGYQHASLRMCDASFDAADCREYGEELKHLNQLGSWAERFRWIVANYQASDPWMARVRCFFPVRFEFKLTGPLGLAEIWPDRIAQEILKEPRGTFFFVHLLTPHSPYMYRRDGSVRPMKEWEQDRADERLTAQEYDERYGRYCEQAEFVAGQLDGFFGTLQRGGVLDGMTVVVHGDHGSRIRRAFADPPPDQVPRDVDAEQLDYPAEPTTRDLLDRFSTLLAIKRAGAKTPSVDTGVHSVLTVLSRVLDQREPFDGVERADEVYLFDDQGHYHSIPMLSSWSQPNESIYSRLSGSR
jgi:Sulfatase